METTDLIDLIELTKKYQKSTLQGEVNYKPTLRNKAKNDLQPYQTINSVDYACGPSCLSKLQNIQTGYKQINRKEVPNSALQGHL